MLNNLIPLIIVSLAVYRVAYMMTSERGPFNLFERWRNFLETKFPNSGPPFYKQHWISLGFNCVYCTSFYISFMFAWVIGPASVLEYVVSALAISTLVIIIQGFKL